MIPLADIFTANIAEAACAYAVALFSSSKMTQVRIEELFSVDPASNFQSTRDLAANNSIQRSIKIMVQTPNNLYLAASNMKEFLNVSLDSEDELPPVNFEINDVVEAIVNGF